MYDNSNDGDDLSQYHPFYSDRVIRACRGKPTRAAFRLTETGCIEWQGSTNSKGYGFANGQLVHRTAWETIHGEVPDGHHVHHHCRNKLCANVDHLEPLRPEDHARADGRPLKLNEDKVRQIIALVRLGATQREVAELFGISRPYVSLIASRQRWRSVAIDALAREEGESSLSLRRLAA
jgi:hypothetical protein